MPMTFRRLSWLMDLVPYAHAPALARLLGSRGIVLDLGGGTGRVARRLPPEAGRVVIADVERAMLRKARARGLDVVLADARHLPIKAGSVDGVLAVDAFHHFPDQTRVLAQARVALRADPERNGILLLEEFDPDHALGRAIETAERWIGFGSTFHPPSRLVRLVQEAGFSRVEVHRRSGKDYVLRAAAGRKT